MTNPTGGTPVVYEDRTLFPTPIQQQQQPRAQAAPKTGLSAAGVLLVAVFAAAIAAAVVYFLLPIINPNPNTTPVAQEPCVPLNTITVNSDTSQFCTMQEWAKFNDQRDARGDQEKLERQQAELAALSKYQTLADAELAVETQSADVQQAITEAEEAGIGGNTLEEMKKLPEAPPAWRLETEDELRQYAQALRTKSADIRKQIDAIRLARARQAGVNSVDRENCTTPGGCN